MKTWDGKERRQYGSIDSILISMNEKMDFILVSQKEISKTVYGNGNPQDGLVWKVQRHQEDRANLMRFCWVLLTGFGMAISVPLFQFFAALPKH